MNRKNMFLKIAIPVIIIIAGFVIMKALISGRPEPAKEVRENPGILVEVFKAEKADTQVMVKGTGAVESAQEVTLIPQVSGRIVYAAPNLNVGGYFKKDAILFEIENTDYKLALERAKSAWAKAEYDLATIESQAQIARSEWDQINRDSSTPANPLVLYEPQLKSSRAALASASAQVEQAKLDLERTKIKAPFNARIRSENIDPGQYVKSGNSVAVLAGTDTAEIAVPLSLAELQWLEIPRHGERLNGADASVHLHISGNTYTWDGRVVRSTGEVNPKSRMMQLIVEIKDPYGLNKKKDTASPSLAAGTFVEVHIKGKTLKEVFIIPRTSLRDNRTIWVMDKENKLRIKNVTPLRMERENVIISKGIAEGDMIVKTNISGAADGMKLRRMK
jgi:RND family efflux transporter MFP subunit